MEGLNATLSNNLHLCAQPSYGDSLFSPLTYLPHALSVDSYPDGEKQSGVPTFTDGQQEIQFGSSGGYVEEMDFGVQPDTAHYQKPSALHGQQRVTIQITSLLFSLPTPILAHRYISSFS